MNYKTLDTNNYKPFTDENVTLLTGIINECSDIKGLNLCNTYLY